MRTAAPAIARGGCRICGGMVTRAEFSAWCDRIVLLERHAGAMADPADRELRTEIAKVTAGRPPFSSRELRAHARITPSLRDALVAADVVTTQQVGKFLQRCSEAAGEELQIVRDGRSRDGARWRCVVVVRE